MYVDCFTLGKKKNILNTHKRINNLRFNFEFFVFARNQHENRVKTLIDMNINYVYKYGKCIIILNKLNCSS